MNVLNIDSSDKRRFAENAPLEYQTDNKELFEDVFSSLVKYSPMIKSDIPPESELNKHIMSELMELPEYKQLRNFTTGDIQNSIANLNIVNPILESIPDPVKNAQENIQSTINAIEESLNNQDYDPKAIEKLLERLTEEKTDLLDQLQEHKDSIRQAIRKSLAKSEQDTADCEQALACLGEKKQSSSPQEKLAIMQALKNNKKLKDIMKQAGRMTNIAQKKQKQKVNYIRSEITGIEQGNDLSSVVPSEYGYLMHENKILNTLFMKKFSQCELQQYKMQSKELKAKGPIICCLDCSGSMYGEPDTWSKACALAMFSIAKNTKRSFAIVLFNYSIETVIYIEKGEHKAEQLLSLLNHGVSGGTNFEKPLHHCLELLVNEEHKQADVIFVTDGICQLTESFKSEFNKTKKELEFSVYTILIGGGREEEKLVSQFSDEVTSLNKMLVANEGTAFNLVFNI
jgi:uncharacterized protein with von Willebrand factor type A (vWA) domain